MKSVPFALVLAATLGACGSQPPAEEKAAQAPVEAPAPATDTVAAATPASGASVAPVAFAQCAVCHSAAKGAPAGVGPNLWDAAGKPAAQKPGFAYSPALKGAGLMWDDATLDKWLQKPMALVPGTRMTFAGLADAAKRAEVIAYLKTLH